MMVIALSNFGRVKSYDLVCHVLCALVCCIDHALNT
jgi:hypothetical protein